MIERAAKTPTDIEAQVSERTKELQQQLQAQHDEGLNHLQRLTEHTIAQIEQEPMPNWKELEQEDPAEYARLRLKFQERDNIIRANLEHLRQEAAKREEAFEKERAEFRKGEAAKLIEWRPEWKDPAVGKREMDELAAYLTGEGFSQEELNDLDDSRYLKAAFKAMQYDALKKKAPITKKRIAKAKGTIRKGATSELTPQDKDAKRKDQVFARLKKTGRMEDAATLMEDIL